MDTKEKEITLLDEEIWAYNTLNNAVAEGQAEMTRRVAANRAYIKLLENKYDATFDPVSGILNSNKKE